MTEDFTTEALHYLLDELDPDRRAAFSERLTRDPVAAEAFKQCADTLAQFALEATPAVPLSDEDRRAELAVILAAASASARRPTPVPPPIAFPRWLWPVAAAVLLGLNLIQFFLPAGAPSRNSTDPSIDGSAPENSQAIPSTIASALTPGGKGAATDGSANPDGTEKTADGQPSTPEIRLSAQLARLEALQREYTELQRARDALNSEYDLALRQLTRRALAEQGVSRLAAMELVDANSYARGDRKGLMNLARDLLTQPGVVTPPASTVPGGGQGFFGDGDIGASGGVNLAGVTPRPTPELPYAWSVFDEKDNQGYLNLYNLPTVTADQSLQVWIKPVDSQDFRSVGEVPAAFYGKSGAVSYTLPAGTATPGEVMITLEPRQNPPTKPTGNVVLRGP